MKRKMTLVFHDEDLYTQLKIEAVKRRTTASDIVSDAVREWLENRQDAALAPLVREARAEFQEKGGRSWSDVEKELEDSLDDQETE